MSVMTNVRYRWTCEQHAVGNVVGKRFIVEKTGAHHGTSLPGSKRAADSRDVGIDLADIDALVFGLKFVLEHDERPISTAFRAGNL